MVLNNNLVLNHLLITIISDIYLLLLKDRDQNFLNFLTPRKKCSFLLGEEI